MMTKSWVAVNLHNDVDDDNDDENDDDNNMLCGEDDG